MKEAEGSSHENDGDEEITRVERPEADVAKAPHASKGDDVEEESQPEDAAPAESVEEPAVAATTSSPARSGELFVLERWRELADPASEWWALSQGIGVRLRLQELLDLAAAQQAGGGIYQRALKELRDEALAVFNDGDSYCGRRFGSIVKRINDSFRTDKIDAFIPGGKAPSTVDASLMLLRAEDVKYLPVLIEDLAADAAAAGMDVGKLRELSELVELVDAEITYSGHSGRWRAALVEDVRSRWENGASLGAAVTDSLAAQRFVEKRKFDVLVPLSEYAEPAGGRAGPLTLSTEEAAEILREWGDAALAELELPAVTFRYEGQTAVDIYAAADEIADRFRLDAGRIRLRGGRAARADYVLVHDPSLGLAESIGLPLEQLVLLPQGLDEYENSEANPRVDDALAQLAQARTGAPATALADLWTAAEGVFGGVAADPHHEAVGVMASLSEFLLVRDLLLWLGARFESAGVTPPPETGASVDWVMDCIGRPKEVLARLAAAEDVLALYRLKRIMKWDQGQGFKREVSTVGLRMRGVAERAYLIRNFVVHQGAKSRPVALAVTLPTFAALVRTCMGYVVRAAERGYDPLPAALHAGIRVDRLGDGLELKTLKLPDDLRPLLEIPLRHGEPTVDETTKA